MFVPYHGTVLRELAISKGYLKPDVFAVWGPGVSQLVMPDFSKEDITRMMHEFKVRQNKVEGVINFLPKEQMINK